MPKLVVRKACGSDAADLLLFFKQVGGESENLTFGAEGLPFTVEQEEGYLQIRMDSHNNLSLVALLDGRIVGSLGLDTPTSDRLSHRGEIGITVLKECWGQGVGSSLLEAMLSWVRDNPTGLRKLDLSVREDNEQAIALYRKFGFLEEGRLSRLFCIDGIFYDGITMGLSID